MDGGILRSYTKFNVIAIVYLNVSFSSENNNFSFYKKRNQFFDESVSCNLVLMIVTQHLILMRARRTIFTTIIFVQGNFFYIDI